MISKKTGRKEENEEKKDVEDKESDQGFKKTLPIKPAAQQTSDYLWALKDKNYLLEIIQNS